MNKLSVVLFGVVAVISTTSVLAAKQDYKCFINSTKKGEQVVFYRWDDKDVRLRVASLPGKQLTDNKGKKYFIKSVEECVPLSQEFSGEKAKRLDKQTLR
ncbi:TapY2 family type IVa secretion system protein [Shewanella sp. Isolate7]|uniref:TapY2 family type IVa secretion system protein n=1 Tax=Shewanella sp. Isolate7 TaxID=2908528 RepID=UPI001EFDDAF5|nr:TapY2 family type IVa secretion system protein [Shewanella sp. Isolate7]MCG9720111.1 TapY2 family type IVa secretion system protein [Shewanella sp. Isolate7]